MNIFGKEFKELYKEYENYQYFKKESLGSFGMVLEFNAPAAIYNNCYKIAREKAKYTMDYSQNLEIRSTKVKTIKQFKGVLAETAIQLYLIKECNISFNAVHRWDLERPNFKYSFNEYDLKITTKRKEFFIESRASDSYKTTLDEFVSKYDIIGPYTNWKKKKEKKADLYIRPVYQFEPCIADKEEWKNKLNETYKMIQSKSLKLYLVSGATKDEMFGEKSYLKDMYQEKTQYRCLRIKDAGDMERISGIIRSGYLQ